MINIVKISKILDDIEDCVLRNKRFSLIRFNDGGLKVMDGILSGDKYTKIVQGRKEGIPQNYFGELLSGWAKCANEANYIDSPEHYFSTKSMSNRGKTDDRKWELLSRWKELYTETGININRDFCSPEAGLLLFLLNYEHNLLDLIRNMNVCCITNFYEIERLLSDYVSKVDVKVIPSFFGNHYDVSFETIMNEIKEEATNYDLWLIGAGELGRLYTGEIKRYGGRAVDIGKIFDSWIMKKLDKRLSMFANYNVSEHRLLFKFNGDCSEI
uniref:Uncharacterized protein n=1 Tax=viral metagenome TaxID=1070528 RepID=A0A6M3L1F7_9ZZZZ